MTIKLDRELADLLRPYSEGVILLLEQGLRDQAYFVDMAFEHLVSQRLPEIFESGRKRYRYTSDEGILEILGDYNV